MSDEKTLPALPPGSRRNSDGVLYTMLGRLMGKIEGLERTADDTKSVVEGLGMQLGTHIAQDAAEHQRNFSEHAEFHRTLQRIVTMLFGTDDKGGADGALHRIRELENINKLIRRCILGAFSAAVSGIFLAEALLAIWDHFK